MAEDVWEPEEPDESPTDPDLTIADESLPVDEAAEPATEDEHEESLQFQLETGVTPSADWEFDDDPASYSAPI